MLNIWRNHKTKIMGGLVTIIQFLQLSENAKIIEKHIGSDGLELLGLAFGVTIIIIGIVNSASNSTLRSPWVLGVVIAAILMSISGCAGTRHAYKQADTPSEYAYVFANHYASLVEQAAGLKESGTANGSQIEAMQKADREAKPVVLGLRGLAETFEAMPNAANEAELQAALDKAAKLIGDFIRAIRAAGGNPVSLNLLEEQWTRSVSEFSRSVSSARSSRLPVVPLTLAASAG